ncbi:glycosyl transferase family 90-domain-containing protein [Xylaria sp. FL0933]|nr:glycosyl transferase family 90-domain-containing protein [Xylaria sp. FL0933]
MRRIQLRREGKLWLLLVSSLVLYFLLARSHWIPNQRRHILKQSASISISSPDIHHLLNLSEQECKDVFPDLTKDLDATVALGPFKLKQAHGTGPLQARIKDGQLYIIHSEDQSTLSPELLQAQQAALYQINRAIITSPSPLPNTIFALNIRDQPYGTAFSYSRPALASRASATPPLTRAFLMPHFAFWNWPLPSIGSISRAREAISRIEDTLPFARKDPRVVWRGSTRFNGAHNPTLRTDLVRVAGDAEWADVRALEGYDVDVASPKVTSSKDNEEERGERGGERDEARGLDSREAGKKGHEEGHDERQHERQHESQDEKQNEEEKANTTTLPIEDFCRYKYIIYTDGVTYSGRLPFHQMCGSVLLTPPLAWRQLTTHLLQPVFSRDLLSHSLSLSHSHEVVQGSSHNSQLQTGSTGSIGRGESIRSIGGIGKEIPDAVRNAWPRRHTPEDANIVFVSPDWSDLEDTVAWLEDHPDTAAGIARRQRELFVGKGYLSPAMETCYWRALIRGWSQVVRLEGEGWEDEEGVSWEEFSIG